MTEKELIFSDIDQELALTRNTLAAIPDNQMDWAPHKKSMKLGALASHLAQLPQFAMSILTVGEFDFADSEFELANLSTQEEILNLFYDSVKMLKDAIEKVSIEALSENWVLRASENVLLNDTRVRCFRMFGMTHMAHHRAQLGVYLRLLDIPVPSVYGPTADA